MLTVAAQAAVADAVRVWMETRVVIAVQAAVLGVEALERRAFELERIPTAARLAVCRSTWNDAVELHVRAHALAREYRSVWGEAATLDAGPALAAIRHAIAAARAGALALERTIEPSPTLTIAASSPDSPRGGPDVGRVAADRPALRLLPRDPRSSSLSVCPPPPPASPVATSPAVEAGADTPAPSPIPDVGAPPRDPRPVVSSPTDRELEDLAAGRGARSALTTSSQAAEGGPAARTAALPCCVTHPGVLAFLGEPLPDVQVPHAW